jgi:hypothetical protein
MRGELAKNLSKPFRVEALQGDGEPSIDLSRDVVAADGKSAVNLKYFQKSHECFSKWQGKDLKEFSGWVGKIADRSEAQITSTTLTCHAHKGKPKTLPPNVSPEVKMYSLNVGAKSRVHGFFSSGHFYLVWLDRDHKVLKS